MTDEPVFTSLATIEKWDKTPDGTLMVYGKASGPELDLDLQICDPEWLKAEMPEWFKSGANIRAMHQPIAAGVGRSLDLKDDGQYIAAEIVDRQEALKVEKGVYTGFSVGIRRPKIIRDMSAPGGRIVGGKIIEVSLADRPANPTAKIAIAKVEGAGEELEATEVAKAVTDAPVYEIYPDAVKKDEDPNVGGGVDRDKLKASDFVFPKERAFPIVTAGDVSDAVSSWGRYKGSESFETFKSRLSAIAKRKGFESSLPKEWTDGGDGGKAAGDSAGITEPDAGKGVWGAINVAQSIGALQALRGTLGEAPTGTDAVLAAVIDALCGLLFSEEMEEATEDDEEDDDEDVAGMAVPMAVLNARPEITKRTFYSNAERDRIQSAMARILTAAQEVFPSIANRVSTRLMDDQMTADPQISEYESTDPQLRANPLQDLGQEEEMAAKEDERLPGSGNVAGSAKSAEPEGDQGSDGGAPAPAEISKIATPDAIKAMVVDAVKAVLDEGLAPLKEVQAGLLERLEKVEKSPAMPAVVTRAVDRGSAVEDTSEVDSTVALKALRAQHEQMAEQAGDPMMVRGHRAVISSIDDLLAKAATQR